MTDFFSIQRRYSTLETLVCAVDALDQLQPMKANLYDAGIEIIKLGPSDLPTAETRDVFAAIRRDLTHVGGLEPTIAALDAAACVDLMARIRQLRSALGEWVRGNIHKP